MTWVSEPERVQTDVLVIGGGAAACMAAISAHQDGARVLVVDKGQLGKSGCSPNAHGGAALYHKDPQDSWRVHAEDTLMSGGFLNDQEVVRTLVTEGTKEGCAGVHRHPRPGGALRDLLWVVDLQGLRGVEMPDLSTPPLLPADC